MIAVSLGVGVAGAQAAGGAPQDTHASLEKADSAGQKLFLPANAAHEPAIIGVGGDSTPSLLSKVKSWFEDLPPSERKKAYVKALKSTDFQAEVGKGNGYRHVARRAIQAYFKGLRAADPDSAPNPTKEQRRFMEDALGDWAQKHGKGRVLHAGDTVTFPGKEIHSRWIRAKKQVNTSDSTIKTPSPREMVDFSVSEESPSLIVAAPRSIEEIRPKEVLRLTGGDSTTFTASVEKGEPSTLLKILFGSLSADNTDAATSNLRPKREPFVGAKMFFAPDLHFTEARAAMAAVGEDDWGLFDSAAVSFRRETGGLSGPLGGLTEDISQKIRRLDGLQHPEIRGTEAFRGTQFIAQQSNWLPSDDPSASFIAVPETYETLADALDSAYSRATGRLGAQKVQNLDEVFKNFAGCLITWERYNNLADTSADGKVRGIMQHRSVLGEYQRRYQGNEETAKRLGLPDPKNATREGMEKLVSDLELARSLRQLKNISQRNRLWATVAREAVERNRGKIPDGLVDARKINPGANNLFINAARGNDMAAKFGRRALNGEWGGLGDAQGNVCAVGNTEVDGDRITGKFIRLIDPDGTTHYGVQPDF